MEMDIANNMKGLTENIKVSTQERSKDLTKIREEASTLKQEAAEMVKDFSVSRGQTSRQLKRDLVESKTGRTKVVMQDRKKAKGMIGDFQDSRKKSGELLRKDLAQGGKLLTQDEKKRKQQVKKMLVEMHTSRKEQSTGLKKELAEGQSRMKANVKEVLTDARTLINSFQTSHQEMGAELKDNLDKSRSKRKADVAGMRKDFLKVQTEVKNDLKGAANAWKKMGSGNHARSPAADTAEDVEATTPVEMSPNLEEKLVTIINQHVEGITLSEVAKELGLVTIVLGKAAKVLVEQGKVRREEKIYFPAGV